MPTPATDHYAVLGVDDGAPPDDVRRAYLELARRLHPDRWIDASPRERVEAERDMQQVNEAWRVLGNPGRRLAYDSARRRTGAPTSAGAGAGHATAFPSGDLFVDDAPVDLATKVLRVLPWALVFLTLAGIFVFTAYATSDDAEAVTCVRRDGSVATRVDCDADGARPVRLRVPEVGLCPAGTEPFQPAGESEALCLG